MDYSPAGLPRLARAPARHGIGWLHSIPFPFTRKVHHPISYFPPHISHLASRISHLASPPEKKVEGKLWNPSRRIPVYVDQRFGPMRLGWCRSVALNWRAWRDDQGANARGGFSHAKLCQEGILLVSLTVREAVCWARGH
jgi:hypothetical protein